MSSLTRVYLPLSAQDLALLEADGRLEAAGRTVHGVTPGLQRAHPGEDVEECEFHAQQEAAAHATGDPVVVGAADLPNEQVAPVGSGAAGAMRPLEPILRRYLVSLHVGDEGASASSDEDLELSWYDITELDAVRRLAGDG